MLQGHFNHPALAAVALGLFAAMAAMSFPAAARGEPITFVQTGTGSGSIGSTPFTNARFTITAIGDTETRLSPDFDVFYIVHNVASISIDGVGDYQFTRPTRTFVNQTRRIPGFSLAITSGADLYQGPSNAAFANWGMLTSLGPITGQSRLLQWGHDPVTTSGGTLWFGDVYVSDSTFQATVGSVPEPSTVALLGMGAVGLLGFAWRRRKRTA